MLKIVFGDTDNSIYHPPTYFDNTYEDEWITYPRSVKMIKDIDKSDVAGARVIDSPVLGSISVKELSGGVKTLILMLFDESGKTTLVSLIDTYDRLGADSGIEISCAKRCLTINNSNWESVLNSVSDSIIFIDEENTIVKSDDFAKKYRRPIIIMLS
ncbi:DUF4869 domain-containing protein [Ruminococcus flavefaciens]|uniref:DUF4869 domain-containing protein n=1 Tax=Ruminococcus flavefaciens TaxID=1265 RepID=UPI0004B19CCC|nr:DUF4869 domain-containing protein [Ruminococcus flavefaciens]